ncbi:MAG: flagellar hook-length control protein FliK [Burkholderiaceae bacterium]|nr:flagellar hook-length control protein FliK [Burkholderiaceae bacterium]
MAGDVQGVVSAAGKRKMPGRLGGGSAQAGDVTSAPGAQSLGVVGAKGQGAPTVPGAVPQPLVAERRDMGGARDGSRPLEFGVDGVPAALAPFVSEAALGGRVLARGAESGPAVSGAGGSTEVSHESPMGLGGEAGTAVADPAMVGAEDAVAEQVAYWVHQNIQNARMTVKHDGQPVEVSVSLTGNEAHVAFGSDEVQTRELLDGSVAQLRDMLRQEGLVLSGVTVGESGRRQGDEGASSGNPKNAPRQAQVVVPAVDVQAAGRARVQGDRAVDIFV